ncbi:MAG: HEPN domain-containing protein [Planctomycetes bacterium]|nr:HEPN domain-containing protein [Planctomycetota bacterium]
MNDEAKEWLSYAEENLRLAEVAMGSHLFNSCIQNAQQATEKALKAVGFLKGLPLKKTHSIRQLRDALVQTGLAPALTDDECDLMDSVYLPSKYPLGSALPRFVPDEAITRQCLNIADRVVTAAENLLTPAQQQGPPE